MKTPILYMAAALAFSAIPVVEASAQTIDDLEFPLQASRIQALNPGAKQTCAAEWSAARQFQPSSYGDDAFLGFAGENKINFANSYKYTNEVIDGGMGDPRYFFSRCVMNYIIKNY